MRKRHASQYAKFGSLQNKKLKDVANTDRRQSAAQTMYLLKKLMFFILMLNIVLFLYLFN